MEKNAKLFSLLAVRKRMAVAVGCFCCKHQMTCKCTLERGLSLHPYRLCEMPAPAACYGALRHLEEQSSSSGFPF